MDHTLDPNVAGTLNTYGLTFEVFPCDPELADTAAFCEHYSFSQEQSANTIIVASRKTDPVRYCACVVLADSRLDVNKKVCELMQVKKASFADTKTTVELTGMLIGGVTAIGLTDLPIYVDARVMQQGKIVMGGGNRSTKVLLHPQELTKLPTVQVVENLAQPKSSLT
ncbi:MAG TPA: YbaK/EbsC family protein [Candidatus Saccharimonadales bacterium]|nr:YbaK/EbsC family protein [Candidatus Saccharimonadales bacterium]